ncbi:MAG: DHHA1 domain-containing protein, partial [Bacilli bacterium]
LLDKVEKINNVNVLAAEVNVASSGDLRTMLDFLKEKLGSGVILLAANVDDKASLVAGVTKDLTGKYKAGELIREAAALCDGRGGGRPDMAQAGGKDASGIPNAVQFAKKWVESIS